MGEKLRCELLLEFLFYFPVCIVHVSTEAIVSLLQTHCTSGMNGLVRIPQSSKSCTHIIVLVVVFVDRVQKGKPLAN